jgi:glycosyltransferase involved in cell wall biosynthesis
VRILQVTDILNRGGAERVLVDLSNLLFKKGHQVSVMTLVGHGPLADDLTTGIVRLNLNRTNKYSLLSAKSFIKTVNEYDIVHLHMRHVLRYYFFCNLFFASKTKVVFHDHWGDIDFDKRVPIYLRSLKNKIYYIGVSRHLCEWAKKCTGIAPLRIFLLSNIVAIDFKEVKPDHHACKVLMISNFRRTKNIEFALQIIQKLASEFPITLDIYGRDQDLTYLQELKKLSSQLKLDGKVNFILNDSTVRDKIPNYDAAIHTATSETGPLVLIEYLANQLPFLSFQTGEVAEQLGNKLQPYFQHDFDVASWTNKMRLILRNEVSYTSSFLKELFEQYYSSAQYVTACEVIYNKVLEDERQ